MVWKRKRLRVLRGGAQPPYIGWKPKPDMFGPRVVYVQEICQTCPLKTAQKLKFHGFWRRANIYIYVAHGQILKNKIYIYVLKPFES
jgi:hypothetical protein